MPSIYTKDWESEVPLITANEMPKTMIRLREYYDFPYDSLEYDFLWFMTTIGPIHQEYAYS